MNNNIKFSDTSVSFVNKYYKDEWLEFVPYTQNKVRYREGNYTLTGEGTKVVYDGATNYMGEVLKDGTFVRISDSEYNDTFLRAAAEN